MSNTQKQTFLQGALILVIANAIVKIIGAIFKIPLANLIGPDGMGIFNTAYTMYTWMFIIATAGLPIAISKMVSESIARNNPEEAYKTFKIALKLLSIIGILGMLALFMGAQFFADVLQNSRAYLAIIAVSPALLFVAIMSAYRGYFQGLQNMIPTAISEVAEALGKLVIGYILAYLWFSSRGIEYASAGAMLGVSTGSFLGLFVLWIIHKVYQRKIYKKIYIEKKKIKICTTGIQSTKQIFIRLIKIAIPITIGASVFSLTNVIDLVMVMNRLKTIGLSEAERSTLYGCYSGYAVPLFNLPPTLIVALGISIVPAIASALAIHNNKLAKKTTESAMRITLLFSLPSAIGLSILAGPILQLIYRSASVLTIEKATELLKILGIAVVFVSIVLLTNAILQAAGKVMIPVRNMLIGGIIKVITNYILVGNPLINIKGAPIGTNLCYFIIVILNLIEVKKITQAQFKIKEFFIKPIISVSIMGLTALYTYNKLMVLFTSNFISTILTIVVSGLIYIIIIILIGGIKEEDIKMLPKGEKILRIINRIKLPS